MEGNKFGVCVGRKGIDMLFPPRGTISRAEALELAAWLVAIAEENDGEFDAVLQEVRNT